MNRIKLVVTSIAFLGLTTGQAAARCCGDCDDDGAVRINELIRAVNNSLDGCPDEPRFIDNGDGTVTDNETGLMWEQKTGAVGNSGECPGAATCIDPHNVNNLYSWSVAFGRFNGGVRLQFLDELNDAAGDGTNCFAGYCDWRLPTSNAIDRAQPAELESIIDCSSGVSCVDPVLGPAAANYYWSSSVREGVSGDVRLVHFGSGNTASGAKTLKLPVRAVRGRL
jgi:hypothetical protein